MSHIRGIASHGALAVLEAGIIALLVLTVIVAPVLAAKGGGKGPGKPGAGDSSSTLAVRLVLDQNEDGQPNWNDQISFDVFTSATDKPWVRLDCYQGEAWVSTASAGFFPAYPWPPNFTLASTAWTSGAAECTATLYMVASNGRTKTLATLPISVAP